MIALPKMFPELREMSREKQVLLASNLMDSLLFAGGQSVPTVLSYCFVLMYSNWLDDHVPGFELTLANLDQFIMETIRFFPPVSGFVYRERSFGNLRLIKDDEDEEEPHLVNLIKSVGLSMSKHFSFKDKLHWFDSISEGIVTMRQELGNHLPPQYNHWDDLSSDQAISKICFGRVGQIYRRVPGPS